MTKPLVKVEIRPEMPAHDEVVRALKKSGEVLLKELTPDEVDLWHMLTGLAGELGELFQATLLNVREDLLEELGDCLFYYKGILQNLEDNYDDLVPVPELEPRYDLFSLVIETGEIVDVIKKAIIYRKDLDLAKVAAHLGNYYSLLRGVAMVEGLTLAEIEKANSEKLWTKRYPDGEYTDEAAQDRADKVDE